MPNKEPSTIALGVNSGMKSRAEMYGWNEDFGVSIRFYLAIHGKCRGGEKPAVSRPGMLLVDAVHTAFEKTGQYQ